MDGAALALLSAAAGILAKSLLDAWVAKKKELELAAWRIRTDTLAARLSKFYWPIYLRLQRDNVVWERLLEREHPDDDHRRLAREIEDRVLLPNHEEIVRTIEAGIHLAGVDPEFETVLLKYLRHVDVYRSLRAAGVKDKDPLAVGEPYPKDLFPLVRDKLQQYQGEYEAPLRKQGVG